MYASGNITGRDISKRKDPQYFIRGVGRYVEKRKSRAMETHNFILLTAWLISSGIIERRKSMISIINHSSRKPAKNYRKRARAVIERMWMQAHAFAGTEKWRELTEKGMEVFIDDFHRILNWASHSARKIGLPAMYFPGPLTEEEMRFVESRFLRDVTIIKFDGGLLAFSN